MTHYFFGSLSFLNTVADYLVESMKDTVHIFYFAEEEKIAREFIRKEIVMK